MNKDYLRLSPLVHGHGEEVGASSYPLYDERW